jgi:hypothetical protein
MARLGGAEAGGALCMTQINALRHPGIADQNSVPPATYPTCDEPHTHPR